MLTELNRRFDYIFDDEDQDFDGSFLLATALDPNLRQYLSQEHLEITRNNLKETLLSLVSYIRTPLNILYRKLILLYYVNFRDSLDETIWMN